MPQASYHFPAGFLWGAATASQQVEGQNNNNCWSAWEAEPGHILHGHKAGLACDWWGGRWKEDFDRAAETGQNSHRLSVEWSRIQPEEDRWDENALDYYRQIIRGLLERGMTPMVTLHHFSDPLWLVAQGGWENEGTPAKFEKFVRKTVEALKEYVTLWVTINEPNVYTTCAYLTGDFPPGKNDLNAAFKVYVNLLKGHALAYATIHALQPQAQVGIAYNYVSFKPARKWMPLDGVISNIVDHDFNRAFAETLTTGNLSFGFQKARLPQVVNTQDYIGVNYYTRNRVEFILSKKDVFQKRYLEPGAELSGTGFIANVPEGIFEALTWAKSLNKPIYVTENGVEDAADAMRPRYILQHLHQTWKAVNLSYPIRGYFHWSLVDNFEWERGWTQRFGLWGLDVDTQARIRRRSVDLYAAICKENGITTDMVQQYAPEIFEKIFPG